MYCNTLSAPFILDDLVRIEENPAIRQLWSAKLLNMFRPVGFYTFAVNHAIHGYEVAGYHLTNIAIHIVAGLLLYGILRRTLSQPQIAGQYAPYATGLSLAIALIWVVHPLQTQAVTYIIQRLESLMGMFYLATLYAFIRSLDAPHPRRWQLISIFCCGLGMGTKEVMVTAPLVVLWYDRAFVSDSWRALVAVRWRYYAALAGTWLVLVWGIWNDRVTYADGSLIYVRDLTPWKYLLSQAAVLVHYLRLCFWPSGQCLDYGWPPAQSLLEVWPQALMILSLLAVTAVCIVRRKEWGFVGGWFFLILAPTSSIMPIRDLAFEHRMYLSLASVAIVAVFAGAELFRRTSAQGRLAFPGKHAFAATTAATLIVMLAVTAYARNGVYTSSISIWEDAVAKAPNNWRAWASLGSGIAKEAKSNEAVFYAEKSVELAPNNPIAHAALGGVLLKARNLDRAKKHLRTALDLDPRNFDALFNSGALLFEEENHHGAAEFYEMALAVRDDSSARLGLVSALIGAGDFAKAEHQARQVLLQSPNSPDAMVNLATALLHQNRQPEAEQVCRSALQIDPRHSLACATLGQLIGERDRPAAVALLRTALESDPQSPEIRLAIANLIAETNATEALALYGSAIELRPTYAEAYYNAANLFIATGQSEKAIRCLERVIELRPGMTDAVEKVKLLREWRSKPDTPNLDKRAAKANDKNSAEPR